MIAVYRRAKPDRLPVAVYSRYNRSGQIEREARNLGLGIIDSEPPAGLLSPPWHLRPGYVSEVRDAAIHTELSWENGQPVEKRTIRTRTGSVTQILGREPDLGSDWIRKPYLENPKDYEVIREIVAGTVLQDRCSLISRKIRDLGGDGVVLGRLDRSPFQKLLIELASPQQFLLDIQTDAGPAEELMQVIGARLDEQLDIALRSPVEIIWQPDNISADMTSPRLFEKYCLPFYTRQGSKCRAAGKVYALHVDGRAKALKDLIARAPVDIIESLSLPEIGGDVTIRDAREFWPDKVICPNFPASLCDQPRADIAAFLEKMADDFGEDTPFILQVSEDIPPRCWGSLLPVLGEFMAKH
jgi:hypothetical protein